MTKKQIKQPIRGKIIPERWESIRKLRVAVVARTAGVSRQSVYNWLRGLTGRLVNDAVPNAIQKLQNHSHDKDNDPA